MSYKFNLDHTLSVADIHDMITIDIKPETRSVVVNGDIEITGYLAFRGSYLTPELSEELFEGYIPVDINLPYRGGASVVTPEIVGFDYRVSNKESLTLKLEVALSGYNTLEPRIQEDAVIEPFDFVMSSDPVTDDIPYSPLVELPEQEIAPETIATDVPAEALEVGDFLPVLEEESVRTNPRLTESASALMDELFALRRQVATYETPAELDLERAEEEKDVLVVNKTSLASQFSDSFRTYKMMSDADETVE